MNCKMRFLYYFWHNFGAKIVTFISNHIFALNCYEFLKWFLLCQNNNCIIFGEKIVTIYHKNENFIFKSHLFWRENFYMNKNHLWEFYTNNHDLLIQKRAHCFFHTVKKSQIVSKNSKLWNWIFQQKINDSSRISILW